MQLKWKKIGVISTVVMYFATFLMQSNLEFLRVWAGESNKPRVNLVAILVDGAVYNSISGQVSGYASYVQNKLSNTVAVVLPLQLDTVSAYDIHRMMENIYFDGLKDVNSSLIGLIMIGDIPLPVVNQDGYVFPTVYPYVDFEDQKYVWDPKIKYFVPNGNKGGQAEIWHGLINYGNDTIAYSDFFGKVGKYDANPKDFIGDAMWYEDFIAEKKGFMNENYKYYRNKIMFSEDLGYQRYSPLMKSLFNTEFTDNGTKILEDLKKVSKGASWADAEIPVHSSDEKHTTKLVQQEIQDSYLADYSELFSKVVLSTRRENIFAGGRWLKTYKREDERKHMEVNADSSLSMIQLKDTLYLGNDNLVGIIQNMNDVLEKYVDDKIEKEKYSMDVVIPVEYKKIKGKRIGLGCYSLTTDYENYYFGKSARFVDNLNDLSIYRGTYRNLDSIDGLRYSDLTGGLNPSISRYDKTNITKKSIGASYDIFSNQVEGNRGYVMMSVQSDISEYNKNKTRALDEEKTTCLSFLCRIRRKSWPSKCDLKDCESLSEFATRWWGGASAINLDFDSVSESRYRLSGFKATDSWRPIFDMGGYQSLLSGKSEGMDGTGWKTGTGEGPQWEATNFKAYVKYSSPTEVQGWDKRRWGYRVYNNHMPNVHEIDFDFMDYWQLSTGKLLGWNLTQESDKLFSIENVRKRRGLSCGGGESYTYRFVSSVIKHDSTRDEEINGIDRDLYGKTGRLGKYYADIELAYSGLYQDILGIVLSGEELLNSLDEKGQGLSGYLIQFNQALGGGKTDKTIPEILSGMEDILSGSRGEFMELYSSISSLVSDDIINSLERIVYLEGGDIQAFYEDPKFKSTVKVPLLSSWVLNIGSGTDLILNSSGSLFEIYSGAYQSLDFLKSQRVDFYSKYEDDTSQFGLFEDRIIELNSGFQNIFVWYPEDLDEGVIEEDENEEVKNDDVDFEDEADNLEFEGDEEIDFFELSGDSVFEPINNLILSFTGTSTGINSMFSQFFGVDLTGNKIIVAARYDVDFRLWLAEQGITIESMSQSELITQYANWAQGDGYDSKGAIENHDLLVGVVEHMSGMNLLTPDRPIDSPRYVSMQAINGKEVKLIYPDLFKVEVYKTVGKNKSGYDIHELLTGLEIKKKLVEYIENKVDEYNTLLNVKGLSGDVYYDRIRQLDEFATPFTGSRPYKPFTYDEFVDAIGGEKMLDVLADVLYYQNLTNKKKLSSTGLNEDMAFIKKSFSLNDRRELILKDYLKEGSEKEKHPFLVIPKYEYTGYEVVYVNSDGGDYIIPAETYKENPKLDAIMKKEPNKIKTISRYPQEQQFAGNCSNGSWISGLLCWLAETRRSPIRISLSFESSLGDVIVSSGFNTFLDSFGKSLFSETEESLTTWKDAMSDYVDEKHTLIDQILGFDSEKNITQREVESEKHNRAVLSGDGPIANALSNIRNNVRISNSNPKLTDNSPTSLLEISSVYDVQNITMIIEGTGDGCLSLNDAEICPGDKFSATFNPKTNPFKGVVKSSDHKAGSIAFDIKYGLGGDNYIEKVVKYTVSPSELVSIDIKFGDNKTVAGMLTPVEVIGRDKYENRVLWGLKKYDFRVSTGRFLREGAYTTGFTTNDFRNLNFYYQAPSNVQDGSEAVFEIVESDLFSGSKIKTGWIERQRLVQGTLEVQLNNEIILQGQQTGTNQSYRLGNEESIYKKDGEIDFSKLQKLDLYMKDFKGDSIDVDSQLIVSSKNGLVVLGQIHKNRDGRDVFFETSRHNMSGGHVTIYYYPTKISGKEVIKIELPGLESRIINLTIRPSNLNVIEFRTSKDVLQIGEAIQGEMFFMDKWGNLVDEPGGYTFYYDDDKIQIPGGKEGEYSSVYSKGYSSFQIIGTGGGLAYIYMEDPFPAYISVTVDKNIFPQEKLNILYLNYFGSDWGNQWGYFSDNENYIENIMKQSNKIITTTTQLVSEDKIKRMLWKIGPGFRVWNPGNQKITMTMRGSNVNMIIGDITDVKSIVPFEWVTLSEELLESTLIDDNSVKDSAFFVPNKSDYRVDKNGILFNGDLRVGNIMNGEIQLLFSDETLDNGDNIWILNYKGIEYGEIIFHVPSYYALNNVDFGELSDRYLAEKTFSEGSTYELSSVGLFDMKSNFEFDAGYKSIENSDELEEQIGFAGDFKNITLFAQGEMVGEATKKFGSEFVINLGDPLLTRKSENENVYGTYYDGGIGTEIYVDSMKQIFGTYEINFDGVGGKDLLVVYLDGSIKLAKNYGGNPDLRNMQDLMHIAVGIEDVFVGDVNGDALDDIMVRTENNQMRAYLQDPQNKKEWGEFDVDGNIVCLNVNVDNSFYDYEADRVVTSNGQSKNPSDISVHKLFVEDMDKDGILDIITYDKVGDVKVFYGGSTKAGANYLSNDKYSCDEGWYNRQKGNVTEVISMRLSFALAGCNPDLQVCGSEYFFDNSMIHGDWLDPPFDPFPHLLLPFPERAFYGMSFDHDEIEKKIVTNKADGSGSDLSGAMNYVMEYTDVDRLSKAGMENGAKYQTVALDMGRESVELPFIPISFLDFPDENGKFQTVYPDPVLVRKSYTVPFDFQWRKGDRIEVNVRIDASQSKKVIFGDVVEGPWKVYYDEDNVIEGLRMKGMTTKLRGDRNKILDNYHNFRGKVWEEVEDLVRKKNGKFAYLVEAEVSPASPLELSYEVEYVPEVEWKDVSLNYDEYRNNDEFPDIKLESVDGCDKNFMAFINKGNREFELKNIPLLSEINRSYAETLGRTDDYSAEVTSISTDANALPGIVGDFIDRIRLINAGDFEITNDDEGRESLKDLLLRKIKAGELPEWDMDIDVDLSIFEDEYEEIEDIVDDITKGMCEGFTLGGSNNCQGLPVPFNQAFFAPGKYHLFGCWEFPSITKISKLEGGLPTFFFPGTVYVAGVPIPVPNALKSPADDFLWVGGGELPSMIRIYAAPTLTSQLGIAICYSPDRIWKKVPSPISDIMGNCIVFAVKPKCKAGSDEDLDPENPNESYPPMVETVSKGKMCSQSEKGVQVITNGNRTTVLNLNSVSHGYDYSFLGALELETSSFVGPPDTDVENSITIGDVEILGGNADVNKIKGGIQQGIRKLLIDKWLDPQIRYIVNQLTKMHINVKLPDVSNLISYEAEVLNNLVNAEDNEEDKNLIDLLAPGSGGKKDVISRWKSLSTETLNDFNQEIANPFESLASLMNQSNIVNISIESLTVKVPFIMNEDIATYKVYLQQWLDDNKRIVAEWTGVVESLVGACNEKPTQEEQQECLVKANEYRESLVEFVGMGGEWDRMMNQIYNNLRILEKYRNFPFEIYEWIHAIDRYMAEVASLISDTLGYLSYWTVENAERFVGYVDAIVLIINIIKTYQLIINFSVEWGKNCGNCARDTYDQYSCKLSLLCDAIELPILQIPNFKLPNVTIDLTDIDLGLDIVLPEFNFQTVRIDLPKLPNLPHPPTLGANIKLFDLPNIPQLPEPPHLPELPSFIPEIEIELPILPPPPDIPKLPNELEALIKIADLIGKIYCIVKGQFGMVGESSVKAKIEQLTQRTYTVDRIDNIMDFTNWTAAPVKNYGVDYEISSHVDMQVNLSDFYSFLDALTTNINNLTTEVVDATQNTVNSATDNDFFEKVSDVSDYIEGDYQFNATTFGGNSNYKFDGITSDEVEYVDYSTSKNRLLEVLAYFREEGKNTTLMNKLNSDIDKIENQISTPNVIKSNTEGIDKVKNQVIGYIENRKSEYSGLAEMINDDYDGFLAMIDSDDYSGKFSSDSGKLLTFNVNLFNLDSFAEENLKKIQKENPYASLLDNKKDIVDGYWDAVNKNSAEDLGLTQDQYLVLRGDISKMKKQIAKFYPVVMQQSTSLVTKNEGKLSDTTLLTFANAGLVRNPKGLKSKGTGYEEFQVDPVEFSAGIYEKIHVGKEKGRFAKVVYSDSFVSEIGNNHYRTSRDDNHDIIMWTENAIYKKCGNQGCPARGGGGGRVYVSKLIKEIPYEEWWYKFDSHTMLKLADGDQEVKNWKVKGQTYDSFTLSWKTEDVDAYLIKLVTRIDVSYEKSDRDGKNRVYYILALPDGLNVDDDDKLELVDTKKLPIKTLMEGKQLVEIVNYDTNRSVASIMVTGPEERKWYYANIATLKFDEDKKTYDINSPWSNQIVAGKQMVGDDQDPDAEPNLFRISTNKIVSEGENLDGYVGTNYILNIPWKDNVALSYINVSKDGKILKEKYTTKPEDSLSVGVLFRTKSGTETYHSVGIDQYDNEVEKIITVNYSIPEITITDVKRDQGGESVSVVAELSQDIDTGNVSFQRQRGETWKTMKTKDSRDGDFTVGPYQTIVRGTPYSFGDKIALYSADDTVIALVDPNTAEIVLQTGYKDSHEIRVGVEDTAIIKIFNKNSGKYVFTIALPINQLVNVEAETPYKIVDIKGNMGMYNGGKAVYKDGNYILLISPTGHLYSDYSLEGTYKYDSGLGAVELTLYEPSDTDRKNPIKVWVEVEPFEI